MWLYGLFLRFRRLLYALLVLLCRFCLSVRFNVLAPALGKRADGETRSFCDVVVLQPRLHVLQLEEDLVGLGLELPVNRAQL